MRNPVEPGRRPNAIGSVAQLYSDVSRSAFRHGEDTGTLRALVDDFQAGLIELTGPQGQSDATILFLCARWMEETESLAELMDNLAETLALAAHEPFRELVKGEIETARPA